MDNSLVLLEKFVMCFFLFKVGRWTLPLRWINRVSEVRIRFMYIKCDDYQMSYVHMDCYVFI
jgi:hypothetical protein